MLFANTQSTNDYYPFGSQLPNRGFDPGSYKFGFNGKENDDEVYGDGNFQDYGMRYYDTRVGRFISVDPITKDYPELTPYQFASNTPIWAVDLDGLEAFFSTNGHFIKYISGSSELKIIDGKKTMSFSNYLNDKSFPVEERANAAFRIANYFAETAGVKGMVGLGTLSEERAPMFTRGGNVFINGLFSTKLFQLAASNYGNIVNSLMHESFHQDKKLKSFSDHTEVYLKQMQDGSFLNGTTPEYRASVTGSFAQHLMNAYNQDGAGGSYTDLMKSFSDSKIDGMSLVPTFSGDGKEIESIKIIFKDKKYSNVEYKKLDNYNQ